MIYRVMADLLVVTHVAFVLFVVFGSLLVIRWPGVAWIHLPAAAWGAVIEFAGWICPLTPIENALRRHAGQAGYDGGFIEHYLLSWLYPDGLTRTTQIVLGLLVIVINVVGYSFAARRSG